MRERLEAAIFDVDGVLLDSPHEQAWRDALKGFADPAGFTTEFYQANVAGKRRMDGALAALKGLGVADAEAKAADYAERKQAMIEELIAAGAFHAFDDAVALAEALKAQGLKLAVASSSKNAPVMLRQCRIDGGRRLAELFDADISGRPLSHGKPHPEIFLLAASAVGIDPARCVAVEDAPSGIAAALAGGMLGLGIARLGDAALLAAAGADLVVDDLGRVDVAALAAGTARVRDEWATGADMRAAMRPGDDPGWALGEDGVDPRREASVESRLAVGNGLIGTRGSRAVSRGTNWLTWRPSLAWASWPRTYVAGLFDTPDTDPAVPALVPVADWLRVRVSLDGETLLLRRGEVVEHRRTLDMRRGVVLAEWRQRTPAGVEATIGTLRLASQAERAVGLQLLQLELDRDGVEVVLEASFEAAGLGMLPGSAAPGLAVWRTGESGKSVAMAGAATLAIGGVALEPAEAGELRWTWRWRSVAGQAASLERLMAVARADAPADDPAPAAAAAMARARAAGGRAVLARHEAAWAGRWGASDIEIEGEPALEWALRFAAYHLTSAANPDDERVSIGARALTGDAYLGHVFWDTETCLLPFYIATWPEAARALLMYRFHTLPAARAKAAMGGWRGALYAWESADTGEETTPRRTIGPKGEPVEVLTGLQEQHISADVAWGVWQYWRATGDDEFLLAAGAEIILETARFWVSRAVLEADGERHIRGVIGPDEYHLGVDDNAYTNRLACWNITRGLELAWTMRERWPERWEELRKKIGLSGELGEWVEAAGTIRTGFDPESGMIEQFAGFFDLDPVDLTAFAGRRERLDVVLGRERTQHSQAIKQADVVALIGLLPELYDEDVRRRNFDHYAPLCVHGSSLSRPMHALVASRLGLADIALSHLRESAAIDLAPGADSAGGVHIAALGGLWLAVTAGFVGLDLGPEALAVAPQLPPGWTRMRLAVCWHGRRVRLDISEGGRRVEAALEAGEPMALVVHGEKRVLAAGV